MNRENIEHLNNNDKELVSLLQKTIQIPSWYSSEKKDQNENNLVDYMEYWIKKNTDMVVERQKLKGGRFNLIFKKGDPETIFLAHSDTVSPSVGAPYDMFGAEIHDGKIWGLGSTDMKSGMCAMAQSLAMVPEARNIWYMLYADEELDFLGMKKLVEEYKDLKPRLIISSDGADLKIGHGCRGLIDFQARIRGQTGHPAKGNGLNAIIGAFKVEEDLQKYVEQYKHEVMGGTSVNLANIVGGKDPGDKKYFKKGLLEKVEKKNNIIPDIADFGFDIRPSSPDLNYKNVVHFLSETSTKKGYGFEVVKKNHDLGAWYCNREILTRFNNIARKVTNNGNQEIYDNPGNTGYIDLQMLWNVTGRPDSFVFGGGNGETAHKANEHIEIESLIKTRDFFVRVLKEINNK